MLMYTSDNNARECMPCRESPQTRRSWDLAQQMWKARPCCSCCASAAVPSGQASSPLLWDPQAPARPLSWMSWLAARPVCPCPSRKIPARFICTAWHAWSITQQQQCSVHLTVNEACHCSAALSFYAALLLPVRILVWVCSGLLLEHTRGVQLARSQETCACLGIPKCRRLLPESSAMWSRATFTLLM